MGVVEKHPEVVSEICRLCGIKDRRKSNVILTKKEAQQILAHIRATHTLLGRGQDEQDSE